MASALRWSLGGGAAPEERGTPVHHTSSFLLLQEYLAHSLVRSVYTAAGFGINTVIHPLLPPIRPWFLSRLSLGGRVVMNTGRPTRQWSAWAPRRPDGDSASPRLPPSWAWVWDSEFRFWVLGFEFWDLGSGVEDLGFRVWGSGEGVEGLGFGVQG